MAAQFVQFGQLPGYKGEKIKTLLSEAPTCVTQLSSELCVVHGTVETLQKELGLTYLP